MKEQPASPSRHAAFDPDEVLRLATFVVGRDLFAIDIMRIREIVRPMPLTPVPKAPAGMIGVVDLRGTVLPVFDLRQRFDLPAREQRAADQVRYLIVTLDGRMVGLVVDEVHDVVTAKRRDLRIGEAVLSGEAAEVFIGICPVGDRLALLLNLRRLITHGDRVALDDLLGAPGAALDAGLRARGRR